MRSTEEIAASIIEEIRNAEPAADVDETVVHGLIKLIHKGTVPRIRGSQFGNRKQNKRYAEQLIKWIEDGQRLLGGCPDTFDPVLLFRKEPIDPDRTVSVKESAAARARSLKDILSHIPRQATLIKNDEIGAHGNSGQDQILAAEVALALVIAHGLPARYSSENSVYCKVARLCFEAMTGRHSENGKDIRRACKHIATEHPAVKSARPSMVLSFVNSHLAGLLLRELRKIGIGDRDFTFREPRYRKSV